MPIYAFECADCGHAFDRLQKLSDPDPAACPDCGAAAVRRCLTAPSFRLAGSGWYETDFKKDGKRNLAEKGEGATADGAKAGAKADADGGGAKPAGKQEAGTPAPARPAEAAPAGKAAAKAAPAAAAKPSGAAD